MTTDLMTGGDWSTDDHVRLLRRLFALGASTRGVAKLFGVSQSTASRWQRAVRAESFDSGHRSEAPSAEAADAASESFDSVRSGA